METYQIVTAGCVTNVGLSATETAASVRAGVSLCEESQWRDSQWQPVVFGQVVNEGLFPLAETLSEKPVRSARMQRLLQLAATALAEALAGQKIPKPALFIALPEHDTQLPIDPARFLADLAVQTEQAFDLANSSAAFKGRAGGLAALDRACERMQKNPAAPVLVGGVDSFSDALILDQLETEGRLKTPANSNGFIPGEGAGFLLLASADAVKRHSLKAVAQITAPSEAMEEGHVYNTDVPYRGDGLAAAFHALVEKQAPAPFVEVVSSMNGEHYWAKEWGVACIRNSAAFAPDHLFHHPVENFGDIGAAFAPVALAITAIGIQKGYRRAPALVYASSDRGPRAATLVTST